MQTINLGSRIFATPVFWQNSLYVTGLGYLKQFVFTPSTGKFGGAPFTQSQVAFFNFPGATPSLSSSGTTNGIIWALYNTAYCTPGSQGCGPTVLDAFDATNLVAEYWNSSLLGGQDQAGNAVKFTVPIVANGKVYVGKRGNSTGGINGSTSVRRIGRIWTEAKRNRSSVRPSDSRPRNQQSQCNLGPRVAPFKAGCYDAEQDHMDQQDRFCSGLYGSTHYLFLIIAVCCCHQNRGQKELRIDICHLVELSCVTAIGTDYGFDQVFSRQLEALARPGEVAINFSWIVTESSTARHQRGNM